LPSLAIYTFKLLDECDGILLGAVFWNI